MAKWTFSIPVIGSDDKVSTLQGEVAAPKDDYDTRCEVRDALTEHVRKQGYEPVEIGLYPKR
ncbi:hypothetical protein [Streptomyces sp. NPDC094149]|uniref:hypothetical protein n=1 Tax=Streptomyces sp. NPDC094149 TaxID=3155079 RepID=UPI003328E0EB